MSADGGASAPLAELRRLAEAATPGPWKVDDFTTVTEADEGTTLWVDVCGGDTQAEKDAAYIAACDPQTVAALVEAVKAAQAVMDTSNGETRVQPSDMYRLRDALAPFASAQSADAPLPDGEAT